MEQFEKFRLVESPAERLLKKQLDYVRVEMEYSREKASYIKKSEHFKKPAEDATSVMGFLGSYWRRFGMFDANFIECLKGDMPKEQVSVMAARALEHLGKTTAGVADKVSVSLWLENRGKKDCTDESLQIIHLAANRKLAEATNGNYLNQLGENFEDTYIGLRIRTMHGIIQRTPDYMLFGIRADILLDLSKDAAVHGLCVWQAYIERLRDLNIDVTMPKPGLPDGQIEVWESKSAKIFE